MSRSTVEKLGFVLAALAPIVLVIWLVSRSETMEAGSNFWALAFSPDGRAVVSVSGVNAPEDVTHAGEVIFWDLTTGLARIAIRTNVPFRSVAFATNGQFLAVGDFGGNIRKIGADQGKEIDTLRVPGQPVNAVAVSPDNSTILAGALNGSVLLWDTANKTNDAISIPGGRVVNLALSPSGRILVVGGQSGMAYVLDLSARIQPLQIQASLEPATVEAVAFSADGAQFITGCQLDLKLWEAQFGKLVREFHGLKSRVNSIALSPDGHAVAAVDSDGTLTMWNRANGLMLRSIQAHDGIAFDVVYSPDGKRLATVGREDFQIKIWDAASGQLISTLDRSKVHQTTKRP